MGLIAAGLQIAGSVGGRFLSRAGAKVAARYGVGVAGVGLATAVGTAVANRVGGGQTYDMGPVKRRRRGVTGRDIQGAQRVAALVHAFGFKPKIKRRKGRR
jgi:hypothetical protein